MNEQNEEVREQNAQVERVMKWRDHHKGEDLKTLVQAMARVKGEKEELEDLLKMVNAHYDALRFDLIPDKMDEDGVEKISYEGIGRVGITADIRLKVKSKDGLYGWLKKSKMGDIISNTVNAQTLAALIRGRIKAGKPIPGTDVLEVTPIQRASITKG